MTVSLCKLRIPTFTWHELCSLCVPGQIFIRRGHANIECILIKCIIFFSHQESILATVNIACKFSDILTLTFQFIYSIFWIRTGIN